MAAVEQAPTQAQGGMNDPVVEQIRELRDAGYKYDEAQRKLGMTRKAFRAKCHLGAISFRERPYQPHTKKARVDGKLLDLSTIAQRYGINRGTLDERFNRGCRGKALVSPSTDPRIKSKVYELGISCALWQRIVDYAQRTSAEKAAHEFDIPVGAVEAALNGKWGLLD